jgi:hypothetical protein
LNQKEGVCVESARNDFLKKLKETEGKFFAKK